MEDMPRGELISAFRELTGEDEKEILDMAQKEATEANLRHLLHYTIIQANEVGQPASQTLQRLETEDAVNEERNDEVPQTKKAKVSSASATTTQTTEKEVEAIKEKVRLLANQNSPSEALILLALDELAKTSRSAKIDDVDIYEELYRQASRNQGKINLVTLVLSVMGGKASDVVGKALVKSKKEQEETKESDKEKKSSSSPLHNLYSSFPPMPLMMPYQPQGYNYGYMFNPSYQGYRPNRGRLNQGGSKPIGPCLYCESMGHLIKDCMKFKAMKQNK
ncbi:uncharacterized protein LOC134245733 [Saccostrea cucullata]|uniref:uncharacterized protein LOC134245733 n=1 Tax=Saccostrea cuccullata TaxID=36930 RepID=UPI002ED0F0E3